MSTLKQPKKPAQKDWHKADIKAALEKAGYTLRGLAKAQGRGTAYFTEALHRPLPKAQEIIAQLIGRPACEIWPSRYEPDGSPKRGLYAKSRCNGRDYTKRMVRGAYSSHNGNVRNVA